MKKIFTILILFISINLFAQNSDPLPREGYGTTETILRAIIQNTIKSLRVHDTEALIRLDSALVSLSNIKRTIEFAASADGNDKYSFRTIDYEQNKIDEGKIFTISDYDADVDSTLPKQYLIITDTMRTNLYYNISADKNLLIQFYENATASDSGSVLTSYNNNRISGGTTLTKFYSDPTVTDSGTVVYNFLSGGLNNQPFIKSSRLILKPGTIYLIVATPLLNNTKLSFIAEIYEKNP
ncbi:MAG: hypothetical protein FIA82_00345 [Melioribacter sp.]|nr:hypothetical protein [Melioribacter sp.]